MAFLVSGRDDEATKLRAFPLELREGAKAWYQTLAPEERRDWETLKTAFIEEFRHQELPEEIWRQLLGLRQTSPNDFKSYEGKFSSLWEKWCASLGEGERIAKEGLLSSRTLPHPLRKGQIGHCLSPLTTATSRLSLLGSACTTHKPGSTQAGPLICQQTSYLSPTVADMPLLLRTPQLRA
ncbi:hypothetical protein L7F22_018191 [Adiantum nelumboides]|nr:hypothetical protein [Adiantum nelumboides]